MTEKYKVTQEFMDALIKWRDGNNIAINNNNVSSYLSLDELKELPEVVEDWWVWDTNDPFENNRRLIAITQWLNYGDVFEVEKPHMFVVRSIRATSMGKHGYLFDLTSIDGIPVPSFGTQNVHFAAKFDSREAAEAWVTTGYKVVEIDEEYQEVNEDLPF